MKLTNNLVSIELAAYNVPIFKENRRKKFIEYGDSNSFPFYLVDLFNGSAIHNSIITGKVNYITGRGLTVDTMVKSDVRALLEQFIYSPNPYETWDDIFNKIALDYELYNGYSLEIKKDRAGRISEVYHVDFGKLRACTNDSNLLYYSDNWIDNRNSVDFKYTIKYNPTIKELQKFNPNKNQKTSILYHTEYRPNMSAYPLPDYIGAIQNIRTQIEISNFDLNTIINGFAGGTLINLFNGTPPDEEQKEDIERSINEKAAGSGNGNRILINFADSKEAGGAEILPLMGNDLPDRFKQLEERVTQSIFIGHKITSPMLFGVKTEGQLGGRAEILEAYELFKETYIQGRQKQLINTINDIFEYKGLPRAIGVEELRPIQRELPLTEATLLTVIDDKALKDYVSGYYGVTISEEKNISDESTDKMISQKFTKVALTYFDNKGVPAKNYEILESYPVNVEGENVKFAIDELRVEFADPTEKELAEIAQILKSNPKLTEGEIAKALNKEPSVIREGIKILKEKGYITVETSGVKVLPAATSIIRLLPNPKEVLLVKYKYGLRLDKENESEVIEGTRDFCRDMVAKNKLYTREEIEGMKNNMEVTFLANIQDVWLYRGGWSKNKGSDVAVPFCRHVWHQVVVKSKK